MYDNVSEKTAIRPCKDMNKRIKNNIVSLEEFMFADNECTAKYDNFTHHTIIHEIHLARRLGWRILLKSLCYAESVNKISGRLNNKYDTNILHSLSAGIQNFQSINDMKIVDTILNLLFQCDKSMIKVGLCTNEQFQAGKVELLERMARFFERKSEAAVVEDYGTTQRSNKCSNIKDNRDECSQTEME